MKLFLKDFNNRVLEIEEYLSFVLFIDKIETHKREPISSKLGNSFTVKREHQKILRSNTFLLLYNLVESSIRHSILAVYDCVHDESLKFENLSERLQEIWLKYQSKKIPQTEKNIKKWLKELMEEVSVGYEIKLEKETINISGNLDYDSIIKIINTYGFFGSISVERTAIERDLKKIKTERNLLAHGNKTFCQSGEIITTRELIQIKTNIVSFLNDILNNIEQYIDNEKFKC